MLHRVFIVVVALPLVGAFSSGSARHAPAPGPDPLDSARAELEAGRYWHAARLFDEVRSANELASPDLFLLARARAGYKDWAGVESLLGSAAWLDEIADGSAWDLFGRALEERGRWEGAADAYRRSVDESGSAEAGSRAVRYARARVRSGDGLGAAEIVEDLLDRRPELASWAAREFARDLMQDGDTASVGRLLAAIVDADAASGIVGTWAATLLQAGDTAAAEASYRAAVDSASDARAADFLDLIGRLELGRGDTAAAIGTFRQSLERAAPRAAVGASARLQDLDALEPDFALDAARALESRPSSRARAVLAYDLYLGSLAGEPPQDVLFDRARLLASMPERRSDALQAFRELDEIVVDRRLGARMLEAWADLRRSQGRSAEVSTLRVWLLERYPESPEAVEVAFLRADATHDRGDVEGALAQYAHLQEMNAELDRAGLGRMRMAQLHLGRRDTASALDVFEGYLSEFPAGRRWEEASYWSARLLLAQGRSDEATERLEKVLRESPVNYYAVQAAALLAQPFRPLGIDDEVAPTVPAELGPRLALLDEYSDAGLTAAAARQRASTTEWARAHSQGALLGLARALIERGATIDGINIGWELQEAGMPWSRALLEVIYPLPYRDMVSRAARERELDPALVAALIRQESAFDADIVSAAGAVGLMQVMPATGAELARLVGPSGFTRENLESPEINLHLGTRFFDDMLRRYDREITLVLSAYNAGPTRANRWRNFPEAADPLRFTERIPFGETRDYVKQVTRNHAMYEALYGDWFRAQ